VTSEIAPERLAELRAAMTSAYPAMEWADIQSTSWELFAEIDRQAADIERLRADVLAEQFMKANVYQQLAVAEKVGMEFSVEAARLRDENRKLLEYEQMHIDNLTALRERLCICDGYPASYEGYREDCPIHGREATSEPTG